MSATVTVPARDIRRLAMVGGNVPEAGSLCSLGYELLTVSSYGELLSEVGQQNLHTAVIHFEDKEAHHPDAFNCRSCLRKLIFRSSF